MVVFSCPLEGGKAMSLCASADFDAGAGWVQHRLGAPGAVQLAFPAEKSGGHDQFLYVRYTRPLFTELRLDFAVNGSQYTVFEDDSSEDGVYRWSAGARVRPPPEADLVDVELACLREPQGSLMELEDKVTTRPWGE